ncbi:hypothetical protein DPMN_043493 [Dreissena polymorpha]|uniref:Uncharacterized protein n=1 Tax=Dreissena polymorpha TaxID=45954 RepID=A0A9D4D2G7_DREPO|nr:hypothetical protein DPMN_043493 [Dreissena polymorpha]
MPFDNFRFINSGYTVSDEDAPKTPIWSTGGTLRIPKWTTTDSWKAAMENYRCFDLEIEYHIGRD